MNPMINLTVYAILFIYLEISGIIGAFRARRKEKEIAELLPISDDERLGRFIADALRNSRRAKWSNIVGVTIVYPLIFVGACYLLILSHAS